MRIAVASGKGGTGKTTVATSLALSLAGGGQDAWYLDCDVEAPNGHLFLHPVFDQQSQAVIQLPQIDKERCTSCGRCVEVCQFHALAKVGKTILVFPQLCHGCGSCTWNCPEGAIREVANPIGVLESGQADAGIRFLRGVLTISEPMPTPVIRQLKRWFKPPGDAVVILDAPPGASCSVVETLRRSDYVILVTEPTPFGLHDLKQMVGILQDMELPAGVIINRVNGPFPELESYCGSNNLEVLMRIPYSRKIAEGVARGDTLAIIHPETLQAFQEVYEKIRLSISNRGLERAGKG